jgi:hypothetical protein
MQDAYPQYFVVNYRLLLRIVTALAHCQLEMFYVFSLHVEEELQVAHTSSSRHYNQQSTAPHQTLHPFHTPLRGWHTVACGQ